MWRLVLKRLKKPFMPLRDYKGYLSDVIEAGHEIQGFLEGKTFEDYLEDKLLRYAV